MQNTTRLIAENITPSVCPVRKLLTREWSPILCSMSPINLVSKNDIGRRSSFMKKSLISDMLTRMLICSSSQPLTKLRAVRLSVSASCPISSSHTKLMLRSRMPTSTTACVRNGSRSCNTQPSNSPMAICPK